MKFKKIITTIIFIISANSIYAQNNKIEKGNENFKNYSFSPAIDIYTKIADQGYASIDLFKKMGDSYYFKGDLKEAAIWYKKAVENNESVDPECYFRYSHALKSIDNYKEAAIIMNKFMGTKPDDSRSKLLKSNEDFFNTINKKLNRYSINLLVDNSDAADYGATFYNNKLVYSSARDTGLMARKIHKWDNEMFTDLYVANIEADGQITNSVKFSNKINSKFHESTPVFTSDGKTVYFTRNNYLNNKRKGDLNGITKLKIYRARLDKSGDWGTIEELSFNSDEYSVAHPALSKDGRTLYFASDMPGTMGLSDIFEVAINADGSFGLPVNLGDKINTEGRETFPFMSKEGILYFASDGIPGLGGLDVFAAKMDQEGHFIAVQNVGKPINSTSDDFNFIINDISKNGYFSSNRVGGKGSDDLYLLKETTPLDFNDGKEIRVFVKYLNTNEEVVNTKVSLRNKANLVEKDSQTDREGKVVFALSSPEQYSINIEKQGYLIVSQDVKTEENTITIYLEKECYTTNLGDDLGKILKLNPILFDTNQWNIRGDAGFELGKLIEAMNMYPKLKIAIRSHTDTRGSEKSNKQLSENRAQSTMNFLISRGIDKDRLTAKGYGESLTIVDCISENCDEATHQLNRRSEFIIIE
ncbi:OmpA family protein [Flavobacterium frigoris]|uniref:Outer membrane lipoprotein omp16 n=1 Tax=Flavobacterium frigoris (strain PS1) TaxID=1086011 RepID=H7FVY5_FLAFP|nr:OmpA family protein [Flavobacterium frigoris]EIA07351.1 outer membrane lipoprotein omp16 precursor [Flavobacterium frigoris PS1]